MDPTVGVLTINMVLGAAATVLMALSSLILRTMWGELKSLRQRSDDHAGLLQNHEARLDGHADDLRDIKNRVFGGPR